MATQSATNPSIPEIRDRPVMQAEVDTEAPPLLIYRDLSQKRASIDDLERESSAD